MTKKKDKQEREVFVILEIPATLRINQKGDVVARIEGEYEIR